MLAIRTTQVAALLLGGGGGCCPGALSTFSQSLDSLFGHSLLLLCWPACLCSVFRLLEAIISPSTTTTTHPPEAAPLTSLGHTRVLRILPVSSEFGPPSFPVSSASLEPPEDVAAPRTQPTVAAPGGLSRSLSASASSEGLMSSSMRAHSTLPSGTLSFLAWTGQQCCLRCHCCWAFQKHLETSLCQQLQ